MRRERKRFLAKLFLLFVILLSFTGALIGIRYREYRQQQRELSIILKAKNAEQEIFGILKGEKKLSEKEAESILYAYGYKSAKDNAAGRRFLKDCGIMAVAGLCLWTILALLAGLEVYLRKREADRQSKELAGWLEKIREGDLGYLGEESDDSNRRRVLDAVDSLTAYVSLIRSRASKEKEETKSLVTDLSHQMKTPLAALTSCCEILKNKDLLPEERKEFQRRMEEQLGSLQQLAASLINISRMETGMIHLKLGRERIFETVLEAVNRVWLKAQKKEIEIQMEAEAETKEMVISHDSKWLCEGLINLLDNAIKYSPRNSRVTIRMVKELSFFRIEIQDEGIGIAKENYHKVFQRFFRGQEKEVQKMEGSGVGLYLVRRIVQGHHGTVCLDGQRMKREKGSIFLLRIPY